MEHQDLLLERLHAIGESLSHRPHALALIGLGSVGIERDRLDAYSDLDFFVIVEDGWQASYLSDLTWLSSVAAVAYCFQNSDDGFKLLYEDGVFCEFAVFEVAQLQAIPFSTGQIVWKRAEISAQLAISQQPMPTPSDHVLERQLGEALTNLYVGLGRFRRGERLSGSRFVQQLALDRVLELIARVETDVQPTRRDGFNAERRFEQRFPLHASLISSFAQGMDATPASALAILGFLEQHFAVNSGIAAAIRRLALDQP